MGFGVEYFKGQKYDKLRKELLKSGQLFNDPEFPTTQKSLFYSQLDNEIVWKRPTDLCNVPKLVLDGVSCEDLIEGELGNRWFITACSSLSNQKQLFSKVVPDATAQEYNMQTYTGMFRFQFWLYGRWTEVVIDDLLPTKHGKLLFCHSKTKNEFWSALLEKAYAKLFGDYQSLSSGYAVDALVDFTGGVAERLNIEEEDGENESTCLSMFQELGEALANCALITVEVKEKEPQTQPEGTTGGSGGAEDTPGSADVLVLDSQSTGNSPPQTQGAGDSPATRTTKTGYFRSNSIVRDGFMMDCGLLRSHGYNIREVRTVSVRKGETLHLVRLQSPWQTGEWMGRWSNVSPEMKALSVQEKTKLGLKFESESEFWMLMSDFLANYTHIEICHLINTKLFSLKKTWTESLISGSWVTAGTADAHRAGGNHAHPSFLMNPQYMFDIADSSSSMDCSLMVSLEQNNRTLERKGEKGIESLCIGFTIMKVEENRKYRLHRCGDVVATSVFTMDRSVFLKTPMYKGRYVIVPSTRDPKQNGQFTLRLYNSSSYEASELLKDEPAKPALICSSAPSTAVQLTIVGAQGLVGDKKGAPNAFCVVKCEGETIKTSVIKASECPSWNSKYIFFKKASGEKSPINIEVYNSQTITNTLLGETTLRELSDSEGKSMELSLFQRSKKKDQPDVELPGKLSIKVYSSDNLSEF